VRRVRWGTLLVILAAIAAFLVFGAPVLASEYSIPSAMIDAEILGPHSSDITGEMVQNLWRWYGIPTNITLAIIGAETSMGDPALGGELVAAHNYGCMRYGVGGVRVAELASGYASVRGVDWWSFPTMEAGMMALGRYLKLGPMSDPGYYRQCFKRADWAERFAAVYYGREVPGFSKYVAELRSIYARVTAIARAHGLAW
jgi:hypothetical protein